MTDQLTPRPWVFNGFTLGIYGPDGERVTVMAIGEKRSDGDLIVRAVNSHDALVEALEGVVKWRGKPDPNDYDSGDYENAMANWRACAVVLAAAKESAP